MDGAESRTVDERLWTGVNETRSETRVPGHTFLTTIDSGTSLSRSSTSEVKTVT